MISAKRRQEIMLPFPSLTPNHKQAKRTDIQANQSDIKSHWSDIEVNQTGLKVNDQLVTYATRFLAVCLKNHVWSHHRTFKAKIQCDFSSAYSPDHTNVLQLINRKLNIDITQPGTK